MKIGFQTLCPITQQEKDAIIKDISVPVQTGKVNNEMWQQLSSRLDKQEEMIKKLLARSEYKQMMSRLDEHEEKIQGLLLGMSEISKKQIDDRHTEKASSFTNRSNGQIINRTVHIDRSKFAPIVDGKKEVREITDSWEEIFASINYGTYRERYKIGNYKPLDLGREGIVRMQIAGFDAEELAHGSGRAAITWIAMDPLKTIHRMNPKIKKPMFAQYIAGTGAVCGWKESEMRKYLDAEIKPLIPSVVKNEVKSVKKYSFSCNTATREVSNEITEDELWIPAVKEIAENSQTRKLFSKYEKDAVYYSSLFSSEEDRKRGSFWWLRSVANFYSFYSVYQNGAYGNSYPQYTYGVVLCFCT